MSYADECFIKTANKILQQPYCDRYTSRATWQDNSPAYSKKIFGSVVKYDLSKEFPISTIRKQNIKNIAKELFWMWQKKSNNINDLGLHIWDAWADDKGCIGKTYGYQLGKVYDFPEGHMDQVDRLLFLLKNNPTDRRMIVNMWAPEDLTDMGLPPCAYETLWDISNGKLNMTLVQRSGDFLAAAAPGGWDCTQYALLQCILAHVLELSPGEFIHIVNNLHIYNRHEEIVSQLLTVTPREAPKLVLNPSKHNFYDFTPDDIELIDYNPAVAGIKFEVAK